MNREELAMRLQAFVAGTAPGKHLYAFLGSVDELDATLPQPVRDRARRVCMEAHLLEAIPPNTSPGRVKTSVADAFIAACRQWADERTQRTVLVLTDVELLARYQSDLTPLYSYWISDYGACVIICDQVAAPKPLSALGRCLLGDETATWRYLLAHLGADAAVSPEGT